MAGSPGLSAVASAAACVDAVIVDAILATGIRSLGAKFDQL
jgi:hypothetical protein